MQRKYSKTILTLLFSVSFIWSSHAVSLDLNGLAEHQELGKKQFIAALYTDTPETEARSALTRDERKRMEMRILANTIFPGRLKRMWIEGIAINAGSAELRKQAQNVTDFSNLLKYRLKAGDLLAFNRTMRRGVVIELNSIELGVIEDPSFFDLLLRTWIGSVPLSSDFRDSLLSAGKVEPDLLTAFHETSTSEERVTQLKSQIAARNAAITLAKQQEEQERIAAEDAEKAAQEAIAAAEQQLAGNASSDDTTDTQDTENSNVTEESAEEVAAVLQETAVSAANENADAVPVTLAMVDTTLKTEEETNDIIDDSVFEEDGEDFEVSVDTLLSEQLYISKVKDWTLKATKYPRTAQRRQWEGTVRLSIILDRDGNVQNIDYLSRSGHKSLDDAARKAVMAADPYPALPDEIKGTSYELTLPVSFVLK